MDSQVSPETQSNGINPDVLQSLHRRDFLKMAAAVGTSALALGPLGQMVAIGAQTKTTNKPASPAKQAAATNGGSGIKFVADYAPHALVAMDFASQFATVEGISKNQLDNHMKLYQGYVKKYNELQAMITNQQGLDLAQVNATYHPLREQVVEQSYAYNGVVLHEAYFGNIGGAKAQPTSLVKEVFGKEFGSWDAYVNHLKAVGKASRGWAVTVFNWRDGRIQNYGLDLHNQTVPWNVTPLVVLDVYEHAYMIDFATNRGAYLDAFMANVDWSVVDTRLQLIVQQLA
jgi:Fe-Mn family superoxide dismutase